MCCSWCSLCCHYDPQNGCVYIYGPDLQYNKYDSCWNFEYRKFDSYDYEEEEDDDDY